MSACDRAAAGARWVLALGAALGSSAARGQEALELPGTRVRAGSGPSDAIVYEVEGTATGLRFAQGRFGYVLARLDDVNGDGVAEFAASAYTFPHEGPDGPRGFAGVFSGRTGERLRHWLGPAGATGYGIGLGVGGDADGDGVRELLVMDGDGSFEALSPSSGARLFAVPRPDGVVDGIGELFAPLGDVDGDGVGDIAFAVGPYDDARRTPEQPFYAVGRVAVHSGANGRLLWDRLGEERSYFGQAVVGVGDASGDGVPDLVVGAIGEPLGRRGAVQSPVARLYLLSGDDGRTLEEQAGAPWQLALGFELAFLGDTDGNGRVEVVAAAPWSYHGARQNAGWVGVYEVPGFRLRYELWGEHGQDFQYAADNLGYFTSEAGDADGDGAEDFLLSTYHVRTLSVTESVYGRLYLHSGRTGALLQVYEGLQTPLSGRGGYLYFTALSPLGDIDGDGRAEFIAGAGGWAEDVDLRGYAQVLRYQAERPAFRRGDADGDGRLTVTDVVRAAHTVLPGGQAVPCLLAYDVDGNNLLDVRDLLLLICNVFSCPGINVTEPAPPSLACGRHARLKPGPRQVPPPCEASVGCGE